MTAANAIARGNWYPRTFFSHAIDSPRQVDRLNDEGGIAVAFSPLGRAGTSFTFSGGQSRSLSLWRTSSRTGFLTVPKLEADVITIRFVLDGVMTRRDQRREHIGRRGRAMMVMFDVMRNEEATASFEALSGTVTRAALMEGHRALEGDDGSRGLPDFAPVVDVVGLPLRALMHTMDRVYHQLKSGVQDSDLVFPLVEEIMIYQLLAAWPRLNGEGGRAPTSAPRRPLQRAKEYIDGHLGQKLLLSDVAGAAGVGVRRLQLAFRSETGKTPVQFILERRLDRAHADLLAEAGSGLPVSAVATRWGFTHMGDFSRRYRARFGESPSMTQRKR